MHAAPYQAHSDTSKAAAKALKISTVIKHRGDLMDALRAHPEGLTDEAMQQITGIRGDSQRPRRLDLLDAGLIKKAGWKAPTSSGGLAVVWIACAQNKTPHSAN